MMIFYGSAVARMNFALIGPEENMKMIVIGEPVDSSRITIMTSGSSKESDRSGLYRLAAIRTRNEC